MTRYFYSDPLAAAWQAKHFGMRFMIDEQPGYVIESIHFPPAYTGKWFAHPDSLHLLEPVEGDLLAVRFTSPALAMPSLPDHFVLACPWEDVEWELEYFDHRIVQRGGIQFMWPESE